MTILARYDLTEPTVTQRRQPDIRVVPATADWARTLAVGDATFTDRFDIPVEPGWQGFREAIDIIVAAATNPDAQPWGPRLFFDEDGALVGNGGWKGPPDSGRVELGYAVAPARRRQGIATAVVRTLLEEARAAAVDTVVAHTLAEPNPSTRVLERCGFTRRAELMDPDEGPVWRWERNLRADR